MVVVADDVASGFGFLAEEGWSAGCGHGVGPVVVDWGLVVRPGGVCGLGRRVLVGWVFGSLVGCVDVGKGLTVWWVFWGCWLADFGGL